MSKAASDDEWDPTSEEDEEEELVEGEEGAEEQPELTRYVAGSGAMAVRTLQANSIRRHRQLSPRMLPYDLLEVVCAYLAPYTMPLFSGICTSCRDAVVGLLRKDETLAAQYHACVNDPLAKDRGKRVWVAVRVKPEEEIAGSSVRVRDKCITVTNDQKNASFFFDAAFGMQATQSDVWSRVKRPILANILERKHVCLLMYGQTGSGKTHTMFGDREVRGLEGVAFRAVRALSSMLQSTEVRSQGLTPVVDFSFLEVYNEKMYDLLAQQKQVELVVERKVKRRGSAYQGATYSSTQHVVPKGLTRRECSLDQLEKQIGDWLYEGASTRTVGKTVFNPQSSRSHAVATLHIRWDRQKETRFYLVDLAGSERAGQYALSAEQLEQGCNINKSLSTMARVIKVLTSGAAEHVPYRDSTLTWLLSDAITGAKARAFMIATVHPTHPAETLSTLRYAQQYSSLKSNQEEINKLGMDFQRSKAAFLHMRTRYKAAFKAAGWSIKTLTRQRDLMQHENVQTRRFFEMLKELGDLEAEYLQEKKILEAAGGEIKIRKREGRGRLSHNF